MDRSEIFATNHCIAGRDSKSAFAWAARQSFMTRSLSAVHEHFREQDTVAKLTIPPARDFGGYSASFIRLPNVALSLTSIASPLGYELRFRPQDHYCLNIPLTGTGWFINGSQTIELKSGEAAFVLPSSEVFKHWRGSSHVLTIHIPAEIFEKDLPSINLPAVSVIGCEGVDVLLNLVRPICGTQCDQYSPIMHPSVTGHLEQALLALLKQLLPLQDDDHEQQATSAAMPYYVRRAERFIRGNYHKNVSLADMAEAAGVSPRSLQYGFKIYHDLTPMQFFKRFRLEHARALLVESRSTQKLSDIAWNLGYESASHFSRDYRSMFGETPSATVGRGPASHIGLPRRVALEAVAPRS